MAANGQARIGISGWTYPPWRGVLYPKRLNQKQELNYASRQFRAIEINGTFYSLQKPDSFAKWAADTPDDFMFTVKGPRFITHILQLKEAATPLANFMASGVLRLGPKLGPFLWQLPPNMKFDASRIEAFLDMLPLDTRAVSALAEKHDSHLKAEPWTQADVDRPVGHALEVRDESFADPRFIEMLRARGIAIVCIDSLTEMSLTDVTADFVYCRLRAAHDDLPTGYGDDQIATWAKRVGAWTGGKPVDDGRKVAAKPPPERKRDVFAFFEHEAKLHAPANARRLMQAIVADKA